VPRLPLTPNGKLDRAALPAPEATRQALATPYVAPRGAAEQVVCAIFEEVLRVERVGLFDDFFELGGHSLLATRLGARLNEAFQAALPLRALFDGPRAADVVDRLAELAGGRPILEEIAALYLEVRLLSEDEVRALLLVQQGAGGDDGDGGNGEGVAG
jgi:hypothetical protein